MQIQGLFLCKMGNQRKMLQLCGICEICEKIKDNPKNGRGPQGARLSGKPVTSVKIHHSGLINR